MAVSTDLRRWKDTGCVFSPSETASWDDFTTWKGSVVHGDDGLWHLFYTGTCKAEQGLKQRIGHATSRDLTRWERSGSQPALDIDPGIYEEHDPFRWHDRAMRDPWVMRDPHGRGWFMYFTVRVAHIPEANDAGVIGMARPADLYTWKLLPLVHTGGFGQLEVPQILEIKGRRYCIFCTTSHHWSRNLSASYPGGPDSGAHYLVVDSHLGPWRVAGGPFLDGATPNMRYAGKIVDTFKWHLFMGFPHDRVDGGFIGSVDEHVDLLVDDQGRLVLGEPSAG